MRARIWNNMTNVRFKALYTAECSRMAGRISNVSSLVLALTSTAGVAGWAMWREYPSVWAVAIGLSQILQVVRPFFPFVKNERDFLEMSSEFGALYLEYERLWHRLEDGKIASEEAETDFLRLREKEVEIQRVHRQVHCPRYEKMIERVFQETARALSINFQIGDSDDQRQACSAETDCIPRS
ncbi:MAG: hypothetical protein NTW86_05680 [Candidatus Sumerlaeota bacterium]|nr:hypothetical protein [Candidatus Sumerlaeota bacterium]